MDIFASLTSWTSELGNLAALANNVSYVIINDKPVLVYKKAIFEMVDGLLMILSSHPPICTAKHFEVCSFEVRLRSAQCDSLHLS
jgi:hypothetical protein